MNSIFGLYFEIISNCNQKCIYCYNENSLQKNESISFSLFKKIVDELHSNSINSFAISGGEPFLHQELIEFIAYTCNLNIKPLIITNFTLFDKELYEVLVKYSVALQITIDGASAEIHDLSRGKGTFNKILENLSYLRNLGYKGEVNIRMNVHHLNVEQIHDVIILSRNLGASILNLNLINKIGAGSSFPYAISNADLDTISRINDFTEFSNETLKIIFEGLNISTGCPYYGAEEIKCGLRISSSGDVFPCQLFMDNIFCIGNIKNNFLSEIINSNKMIKFITLMSLRRDFIPECHDCAYQGFCFTGCPAEAYFTNHNIFTNCGKCNRNKKHFSNIIQNNLLLLEKKTETACSYQEE